jgi:hypothetical protein
MRRYPVFKKTATLPDIGCGVLLNDWILVNQAPRLARILVPKHLVLPRFK